MAQLSLKLNRDTSCSLRYLLELGHIGLFWLVRIQAAERGLWMLFGDVVSKTKMAGNGYKVDLPSLQ